MAGVVRDDINEGVHHRVRESAGLPGDLEESKGLPGVPGESGGLQGMTGESREEVEVAEESVKRESEELLDKMGESGRGESSELLVELWESEELLEVPGESREPRKETEPRVGVSLMYGMLEGWSLPQASNMLRLWPR